LAARLGKGASDQDAADIDEHCSAAGRCSARSAHGRRCPAPMLPLAPGRHADQTRGADALFEEVLPC
jgi:hypothetical protein